jgi:hypothetical protein
MKSIIQEDHGVVGMAPSNNNKENEMKAKNRNLVKNIVESTNLLWTVELQAKKDNEVIGVRRYDTKFVDSSTGETMFHDKGEVPLTRGVWAAVDVNDQKKLLADGWVTLNSPE